MKLTYKKAIWTGISMPILYKTWWAYNWQVERKVWKQDMIDSRTLRLQEKPMPVNIEDIPFGKQEKE